MNKIRISLKKIIIPLLSTISAILLGVISTYYTQNKQLLEISPLIATIIIGLTSLALVSLLIYSLIHWRRKKRTFWKNLNPDEAGIIEDYLDAVSKEIAKNSELGFDPQGNNYVTLSGILIAPQPAEEEKRPGFREPIKNIDSYLRSPQKKFTLVSGSPGSGKSTTLYKAFLEFQKKCKEKESTHIPVFLHANQIAKLIERNNYSTSVVGFIRDIYEDNSEERIIDFIVLCQQKSFLKFVIIVDALDEFLNKRKRELLFDYLERLIETNKKTDTRWILSCREDDYRAYSGRLKVANVRLKTMNLKQRKEFEKKRIKTADFSGLPPDERREELIKARRFLAALKKAEDKEETFLSNPYYLALWLQKVFFEKTFKPDIESIEELHEIELRREIAKVIYKNPNPYEKVDSRLIENTKNVLSVISYYLLEFSLGKEANQNVELASARLFSHFSQLPERVIETLISGSQDDKTQKRINNYYDKVNNRSIVDQSFNQNEDENFIKLLTKFKVFFNLSQDSTRRRLIIIASIIEQAASNCLIRLDDNFSFRLDIERPFVNQRVADYLVAYFLQLSNLKTLQQDKINPWWSRPIAIALAISDQPEKILQSIGKPKDFVIESAIIDGLTLIPSDKKPRLKNSIKNFSKYFLDEERLFGDSRDPCDPLRALRGLYRLCISGYSDYIEVPDKISQRLLKHQVPSIAESATIALLLHACQTPFKFKNYMTFFQHFLNKAIHFKLLPEGAFRSVLITIKESTQRSK